MELKGQGFTLREWRPGDVAALQKHADNRKIFDGVLDRFPSPYTMDDATSWVDLMMKQDPFLVFAIAVDDILVGAVGLEARHDVYRKTWLIGYWLGEEYWGRGIMPEAVNLVTDYAFKNFDIIRLQAAVFGNNTKSMRVLEKAGYVKEAIFKNSVVKNGVPLDEHLYRMLRPV